MDIKKIMMRNWFNILEVVLKTAKIIEDSVIHTYM